MIANIKDDRGIKTLGLGSLVNFFLNAGSLRLSVVTAVLIVSIALADWSVGNSFSLGVLYILPMMSGAILLGARGLLLLAVFCSTLRYWFDTPGSQAEVALRFIFASSAYYAAGLFVNALVSNRTTVMKHLAQIQHEQALRVNAEQQMEMMIASSSAAILTIAGDGAILAANSAAEILFLGESADETLLGVGIRQFMPVLADAVEMQVTPQAFRTDAQCQGRRRNGEVFQAHTWFSSYTTPGGPRLAAIVVDSSEEMREREGQMFHELARSSRITAGALSHEIRNLCGAISVLASNLNARHGLALDEDHRALVALVKGLEKVAALNLSHSSEHEPAAEATDLRHVLDDLRIIIEAEWAELGGVINWPQVLVPRVLADPHGLLQSFLNLSKNSLRAVRNSAVKTLSISISHCDTKVNIIFLDSGAGVDTPERLFRPFDSMSEGSGLGLYISRTMLRTYGGDLRYQPTGSGASFIVELQIV